MSLILGIVNDFFENYVKKNYKDGHYLAFSSRVPVALREKLSEEELRQLSEASLDVLHSTLNMIKEEVVKRFGGGQ